MRQAIEEGFILDVLQNYVTYERYFQISKKVKDDPTFEKKQIHRAIQKFISQYDIKRKTEIMIEHFNTKTKYEINGKAKAMVVTNSRLSAVKYYYSFKEYIEQNNYKDIKILVAFSGSLEYEGEELTEEKINKIKKEQLKTYFHNEYNILIVAEKYQTGFDESLLHTMFVDKKLVMLSGKNVDMVYKSSSNFIKILN